MRSVEGAKVCYITVGFAMRDESLYFYFLEDEEDEWLEDLVLIFYLFSGHKVGESFDS